jgi:hypothetical protein
MCLDGILIMLVAGLDALLDWSPSFNLAVKMLVVVFSGISMFYLVNTRTLLIRLASKSPGSHLAFSPGHQLLARFGQAILPTGQIVGLGRLAIYCGYAGQFCQ